MEEIAVRSKKVYACAIGASIATVGGKWKPHILGQLIEGTRRFGELHKGIGHETAGTISQKVLSQQLKELEDEGIVERTVYPEVPPRVEYRLTPYGETLRPVLELMKAWGQQHLIRRYSPEEVAKAGC